MKTPDQILQEIAGIRRMERGTLCRMREGASGPYYNHQTWEKGRNVVRYVPRDRAPTLQTAIDGYRRFLKLVETYADLIIRQTREDPQPRPSAARRRRRP
jgi:hypothetical protein